MTLNKAPQQVNYRIGPLRLLDFWAVTEFKKKKKTTLFVVCYEFVRYLLSSSFYKTKYLLLI